MQVRLRQLEEEDLPLLRDWRNDDELRTTFREYRLLNMINQRAWLIQVSTSRETEMFGIEVQGMGGNWSLVGACGLCYINWVNRTADVSLYVDLARKDREEISTNVIRLLTTKGFDEFNLQRLQTEVYSFDMFKISLLEQCGFVREGELRRRIYKNGKYWDSYLFRLLREAP